jgi:hypothetical protein
MDARRITMEERFVAIYDALPIMSAQTVTIMAEYATPWREVFISWMFDAPLVDVQASWGAEKEAIREVDIHLKDPSGNHITKTLAIKTGYLRGSFGKNANRAFLRARYSISSTISPWICTSLDNL